MQPGRTTPLTQPEIDHAFATAPNNDDFAVWYDSDGKLHRDGDLPAFVYLDGTQEWYQHGDEHRDGDLPAQVFADGTQFWFKHRKWHRDGGLPAIIYTDGTMEWYTDHKYMGNQDDPPPGALFPGQQVKSASKK